jgi:hypothetical protein
MQLMFTWMLVLTDTFLNQILPVKLLESTKCKDSCELNTI